MAAYETRAVSVPVVEIKAGAGSSSETGTIAWPRYELGVSDVP